MPRPVPWERTVDAKLVRLAEALQDAGHTDRQIADALADRGVTVSRSAVRDWRHRVGRKAAVMARPSDHPGMVGELPAPKPGSWTSGIVVNPDGSRTVTGEAPVDLPADTGDLHARLLAMEGLDPAEWVITGPVNIRRKTVSLPAAWHRDAQGEDAVTRPVENTTTSYSFTVVQRNDSPAARADINELCKRASRRRPARHRTSSGTPVALLVALADWQLGKGEGGGTPATVDRILAVIDQIGDRVRDAKRAGWDVREIVLAGLGDLVEGCAGHYDMQTFSVDLTVREQDRLARRLILAAVDAAVDTGVPRVTCAAVAGNHGEQRNGSGRAFTAWSDNRDLAAFEQVAEITAANPDRYGHVRFALSDADEDLALTLDVQGVPVALAHGHQFRGGSGHAAAHAEKWWQGQVMGSRPAGQARILIAGHRHHFVVSTGTGRTFMQAPAMDGGSAWWRHQTGADSPPGTLSVLIGEQAGPLGWAEVLLLS